MKIFLSLVAGAATVAGMHFNHYTDVPECTEKISGGIHSISNSVIDLYNHTNSTGLFKGLADAVHCFHDVQNIVEDCKKIATEIGPVIRMPEPKKKIEVHGEGACLDDIKALVDDARTSALALSKAMSDKSIKDILEALKDIKKVEADMAEAKADCTGSEMKGETMRTPCAKSVDAVMHKVHNIGLDIQGVIKHGDLLKVLAVAHEIIDVPSLGAKAGQACSNDIQKFKEMVQKHNIASGRRRSIFDTIAGQLRQASKAAASKFDEITSAHNCFDKSNSVYDHVKALAGLLDEKASDAKNAFKHLIGMGGMHEKVGHAIIACHNAHDNF